MNYISTTQINIKFTREDNIDEWDLRKEIIPNLVEELKKNSFTQGVFKEVVYFESHQVNVNIVGELEPERAVFSKLIRSSSNNEEYEKMLLNMTFSQYTHLNLDIQIGKISFKKLLL